MKEIYFKLIKVNHFVLYSIIHLYFASYWSKKTICRLYADIFLRAIALQALLLQLV